MEAITGKISPYITLIRIWIVIALEIKNPESIQMRMYTHMEGIRFNVILICLAIFLLILVVAWLTPLALA